MRFLIFYFFFISIAIVQPGVAHAQYAGRVVIPVQPKAGIERNTPENPQTVPPLCFCRAVTIMDHPVTPDSACGITGAATFSVTVNGTGPFTYQWRENMTDLHDNGIYSGTSTPTLTISNPDWSMQGKRYRCLVKNCLDTKSAITNNDAVLNLKDLAADIDLDGTVMNSDFLDIMQAYNSTCLPCREDIDKDGQVINEDFLILLGKFGQQCQQ